MANTLLRQVLEHHGVADPAAVLLSEVSFGRAPEINPDRSSRGIIEALWSGYIGSKAVDVALGKLKRL